MKRLILTLALIPAAASAEFHSGNSLLALMNGDATQQGVAIGYVMGAADVGLGVIHCAPPTATAGQLRDIIKRALEAMPQHRHQTADLIIGGALGAVFPCKRSGNGKKEDGNV